MRFGEPLGYEGSRRARKSENPNLKSPQNKAINKNLEVLGPIEEKNLLDKFQVSSVCIVLKDMKEWRVVHVLSFPEWESINIYIDKENFPCRLQGFETTTTLISKAESGSILLKID